MVKLYLLRPLISFRMDVCVGVLSRGCIGLIPDWHDHPRIDHYSGFELSTPELARYTVCICHDCRHLFFQCVCFKLDASHTERAPCPPPDDLGRDRHCVVLSGSPQLP